MSSKHLLVVLRTCDGADVHPERGPRFIEATKQTLIKKCLISLLESIKRARHLADIELHVLDDGSAEDTVDYIKRAIERYQIKYKFETCEQRGYNGSAFRQFEICRDRATDWVYCVEDDYLHYPEAIEQMLLGLDKFVSVTGSVVAIRPDDDAFTYAPNNHHSRKPCRVLLGDDRHWRTLTTTHNTLLTHVSVFREYWPLFASLAKYFKKLSINEDCTINLIWEVVPLFSPIPGLAVHVSQNNEPRFLDYRSLWESIET